jgi:hypothetical protein
MTTEQVRMSCHTYFTEFLKEDEFSIPSSTYCDKVRIAVKTRSSYKILGWIWSPALNDYCIYYYSLDASNPIEIDSVTNAAVKFVCMDDFSTEFNVIGSITPP